MTRFNRPRRNHCWARSCRGSSAHGCNGSDLYRSPGAAVAAAPERLAYVAAFDRRATRTTRSRWWTATPARRPTAAWSGGRTPFGGQRTAPLRVERMLERAVPRRPRPPPPTGATLSRRSGHSLVAHLRARHQTRPTAPDADAHDRRR
ncbi:putative selenium-binding protein [Mycobacterium xenopi 4042]|uniref:Putative selenium-binding protein n=1 Tax=Mycobacterium xenopi 4042 TaxID=1299334 RepID=X8DCS0_MYCXE|nr:putative selenium-binding protein [Mycobacterium xenopi 4042]